MLMPAIEPQPTSQPQPTRAVLELTARHHPGVMSHVCGLLARRAYPVDGLVYLPLEDGRHCRIWLRVQDTQRLPNLIEQLRKLEDVLDVCRLDAAPEVFNQVAAFVWE